MSEAGLVSAVCRPLSSDYDPADSFAQSERERGFMVVRPGGKKWFRSSDWKSTSVASINGNRVRLVLLDAIEAGKGAFTRTLQAIEDAGLRPCVIDPTPEFAAALKRRDWRGRSVGSTFKTRETVWYPRSHHRHHT